jgi:hypothetical protein
LLGSTLPHYRKRLKTKKGEKRVWQTGTFPADGFQVAFSNFIIVSGNIFVVPEFPFGPVLGVAACFAAFIGV